MNKPFCFVRRDEFGRVNKLWTLHEDGETYQLLEDGKNLDEAGTEDLESWNGEFLAHAEIAARLAENTQQP